MIELEKLYEIADARLLQTAPEWRTFAREFQEIFGAKMALHRPRYVSAKTGKTSPDIIIATTSADIMAQYFGEELYKNNDLRIDPDCPFEPVKRTDTITDKQMKKLPYWESFLRPHKIHFVMAVFAVLSDGSFLVLFVWRDKKGLDFSDIEKQRLALFMRHIAMIVGADETKIVRTPSEAIINFGNKYHLTGSEIEILSSLIQGHSLKGIANETERSYGTVRWHVRNLLHKCHVKTQQNLLTEFYRLIKR